MSSWSCKDVSKTKQLPSPVGKKRNTKFHSSWVPVGSLGVPYVKLEGQIVFRCISFDLDCNLFVFQFYLTFHLFKFNFYNFQFAQCDMRVSFKTSLNFESIKPSNSPSHQSVKKSCLLYITGAIRPSHSNKMNLPGVQ